LFILKEISFEVKTQDAHIDGLEHDDNSVDRVDSPFKPLASGLGWLHECSVQVHEQVTCVETGAVAIVNHVVTNWEIGTGNSTSSEVEPVEAI